MQEKREIMNVLLGVTSYNTLTSNHINLVNKALEALKEQKDLSGAPTEKLNFNIKFNHNSDSLNEAFGGDKRTPTMVMRKIEDIEEEYDSDTGKRSITLERALEELNPVELVFLISQGLLHLQEIKQKEAIMKMIMESKGGDKGKKGGLSELFED